MPFKHLALRSPLPPAPFVSFFISVDIQRMYRCVSRHMQDHVPGNAKFVLSQIEDMAGEWWTGKGKRLCLVLFGWATNIRYMANNVICHTSEPKAIGWRLRLFNIDFSCFLFFFRRTNIPTGAACNPSAGHIEFGVENIMRSLAGSYLHEEN